MGTWTHQPYLLILILTTILLYLHNQFVHCYNLDTQKALLKHGPKGSYFGYSLAQHAVFDQSNDAQNKNSTYRSFVIVGAPRAEATRLLNSLAGIQRPGAIYKCDFSQSQSCQLLEVDPGANLNHIALNEANSNSNNNNNNNIDDDIPPSASSSASNYVNEPTGQLLASAMDPIVQYDNQWLGVSVKSQGSNGYAMACAHRQVLKGPNYRWGQGICYSLTRNLTYHKTWQPCLNRPVNAAHEQYAYCQVGTSCDISDTSDIVLGSPGPYTWRGTLFANSIAFTPKDDRTWYMAPVQEDESKVDYYSYLGMSVITGKFFNKQQYFIAGAPRSKEIGQVLVMTKHQASSGRRGIDSNFKTTQIIDGEQVGASFGYSLAKLDVNGDGLLDLAIGAPFYFNKSDGGAVYLYLNDGKQQFIPQFNGKLIGKRESRFGFALANCGDLNHDKYEDLAIGAPYESQGGVVYIHLGSANGIKPIASQEIRASSINTNMQTFGYSLSGGLDMDLNGYPDLAVGSYADDAIYILRARPIIEITTKIEGNLSRIDVNKTTCDGEKNSLPCFKFNTCFELDPSALGEYSDSMKLKYRIEAETFTGKKYSRVKFYDSENSDNQHILEREILIDDYNKGLKLKRCNAQRVLIRDRSDIQTPIQFKLTYSIVQPNTSPQLQPLTSSSSLSISSRTKFTLSSNSGNPGSPSSLTSSSSSINPLLETAPPSSIALPPPFPILNQEEALRIFSARFLKDCGSNDICESHLSVDGEIAGPKVSLGINEPGQPWDKQINVTVKVQNSHEPAYESRLFVQHPANLIYSGVKSLKTASFVDCSSIERNLIKCELGNPMPRGQTKLFMLFNTLGQAGTFDFSLMVNTTSVNSPDAKSKFELSKTIAKKIEISYPQRQPPVYPEITTPGPPGWLIFLSILLGIILFALTFYCLYIHGFFERRNKGINYTPTDTDERYR